MIATRWRFLRQCGIDTKIWEGTFEPKTDSARTAILFSLTPPIPSPFWPTHSSRTPR
jgi:hypothetical protein